MTTLPGMSEPDVKARSSDDTVRVSDTFWGYVVRPGRKAHDRAAVGEMIATFASMMLAMAAYAQWLLPGANTDTEVLPFKIAATVIFAFLASLLFLIARRGLCYEVQIDKQRGVVRTVRRNRHGASTQTGLFAFHDIDRIVIKPSLLPVQRYLLLIQPGANMPEIEVAVGLAEDLEPVLTRMSLDLRNGNNLKEPVLERPRTAAKAARARSAFSPKSQTIYRH